jgi:dethiobiotin synthetase
LAQNFGLPVVLVVGLRLGCINHALLTAQAVRSRGLRLLGWVGNCVDPNMAWRDDTIAYLRTHLSEKYEAACLGCVPWLSSTDPETVASHLDSHTLKTIFPCR